MEAPSDELESSKGEPEEKPLPSQLEGERISSWELDDPVESESADSVESVDPADRTDGVGLISLQIGSSG